MYGTPLASGMGRLDASGTDGGCSSGAQKFSTPGTRVSPTQASSFGMLDYNGDASRSALAGNHHLASASWRATGSQLYPPSQGTSTRDSAPRRLPSRYAVDTSPSSVIPNAHAPPVTGGGFPTERGSTAQASSSTHNVPPLALTPNPPLSVPELAPSLRWAAADASRDARAGFSDAQMRQENNYSSLADQRPQAAPSQPGALWMDAAPTPPGTPPVASAASAAPAPPMPRDRSAASLVCRSDTSRSQVRRATSRCLPRPRRRRSCPARSTEGGTPWLAHVGQSLRSRSWRRRAIAKSSLIAGLLPWSALLKVWSFLRKR